MAARLHGCTADACSVCLGWKSFCYCCTGLLILAYFRTYHQVPDSIIIIIIILATLNSGGKNGVD